MRDEEGRRRRKQKEGERRGKGGEGRKEMESTFLLQIIKEFGFVMKCWTFHKRMETVLCVCVCVIVLLIVEW